VADRIPIVLNAGQPQQLQSTDVVLVGGAAVLNAISIPAAPTAKWNQLDVRASSFDLASTPRGNVSIIGGAPEKNEVFFASTYTGNHSTNLACYKIFVFTYPAQGGTAFCTGSLTFNGTPCTLLLRQNIAGSSFHITHEYWGIAVAAGNNGVPYTLTVNYGDETTVNSNAYVFNLANADTVLPLGQTINIGNSGANYSANFSTALAGSWLFSATGWDPISSYPSPTPGAGTTLYVHGNNAQELATSSAAVSGPTTLSYTGTGTTHVYRSGIEIRGMPSGGSALVPSLAEAHVGQATITGSNSVVALAFDLLIDAAPTGAPIQRSYSLGLIGPALLGALTLAPTDVNAAGPYTVLPNDFFLEVRQTAATPIAILLPAISAVGGGRLVAIIDSGYNAAANNITITPNGTDKIANVAGNYVQNVSGSTIWLKSNANTPNWEKVV
jgi:hypothetical protein